MVLSSKELFQLKGKIENAKTRQSQLEGERIAILKQLQKEHDCKTIEEAEAKVVELEGRLTKLQERLEKKEEELDTKLQEVED